MLRSPVARVGKIAIRSQRNFTPQVSSVQKSDPHYLIAANTQLSCLLPLVQRSHYLGCRNDLTIVTIADETENKTHLRQGRKNLNPFPCNDCSANRYKKDSLHWLNHHVSRQQYDRFHVGRKKQQQVKSNIHIDNLLSLPPIALMQQEYR
jgi:hypothetical protein